MRKRIKKLAAILLLSGFSLAGGSSFAAEFEVTDRFSVDGYAVLRGSADIPGGSFTVGGSTLVVKDGKIGVGTAAPTQKLTVKGEISLMDSGGRDSSRIAVADDLASATDARFLFRNGTDTYGALRLVLNSATAVSFDAVQANNSAATKNLLINVNGGNVGIGYGDPGTARLAVNGNIGIGTVSPGEKLAVVGNLYLNTGDPYIYWDSNYLRFKTKTASVPVIELRGSSSGSYAPRFDMYNGADNAVVNSMNSSGSSYFNGGNVGIGTTAPGYKLEVSGDARVSGLIYGRLSIEWEMKNIMAGACLAGGNAQGGRFITVTTTSGQHCATACTNALASASCAWGVTFWSWSSYYGYNNECSTGVNYQQGSSGYICCCSQGASGTYPIR